MAALALVAVVALGAAWQVGASQGSPRARTAAATTRAKLERELQQFLANRAGSPLLRSGPGPCFVADQCSLKPCVLLIGQPAATPAGATLVTSRPAVPDDIPASGACHGRIGTPHTFLISGR